MNRLLTHTHKRKRTIILLLFLPFITALRVNNNIIVNDVDWAPYFFLNDEKNLQGIGKEVINHCTQKLAINIDYQRLPVKRTYQYMQQGVIDLTVYSFKKSRENFLYYGKESIFKTEFVFITKANSLFEINNLSDLKPLKIGYLLGLTYTPELMNIIEEKSKKEKAVVAYNWESMFAQILAPSPRFDIMADSKDSIYWRAKILNVTDKIKVLPYKIKQKDYFITVSKKSKNISNPARFLEKMDSCIRNLKQSGKYQEILSRYGIH